MKNWVISIVLTLATAPMVGQSRPDSDTEAHQGAPAWQVTSTQPVNSPKTTEQYLGPRMLVWLPPPISDEELLAYSRHINLSDEQRHFWQRMGHTLYIDQARQLISEFDSLVEALAIEGGKASVPVYTDRYVEVMSEYIQVQHKVFERMSTLDGTLFDTLSTVLAPEQQHYLEQVKVQRKRRYCDTRWASIPSAMLDLGAIFDQIKPSVDAANVVKPIVAEYQAAAVPMLLNLHKARQKHAVEGAKLNVKLFAPDRNTDELLADRSRLLANESDWEIRLLKLNKSFVQKICEALPQGGERDRMKSTFNEKAYFGRVYPDAMNPTSTFSQLSEAPNLSKEATEAMEDLFTTYERAYELLCSEMEKLDDEWRMNWAKSRTTTSFSIYVVAMRKLREQRWALNRRLVEQAAALVPLELSSPIIAPYNEAYDSVLIRSKTDSYPPQ